MNIQLSVRVLQELRALGVTEFCVCAGNRNSPLILTLEKTKGVRLYTFVDERSAAFFALGRIHALGGRPVAVVMTSGTAVAECLPAVIEAHYQNLPLVIVSADRPRAYRGSGAPQAIEQVGIFGPYVQTQIDVEHLEDPWNFPEGALSSPVHLNVCFDEPLIDEDIPELLINEGPRLARAAAGLVWTQGLELDRPLIIVGSLLPEERPMVRDFLMRMKSPVWLESLSALRRDRDLHPYCLKGGDKSLGRLLESGRCGSVLRLGGVPTTRIWRDLEQKFELVPVFNVSHGDFSGLARSARSYNGFHHLEKIRLKSVTDWSQVFDEDEELSGRIQTLMEKYPLSELGLLHRLNSLIGESHQLYLGNSLPVRHWDYLGWSSMGPRDFLGNRGANGIDGQLSTYLGWTADWESASLAVLGDLTTLYDLNALWILPQLAGRSRNLFVVNNNGGRIFQNFSSSANMILPHQLNFEGWAKMWSLPYARLTELSSDQPIVHGDPLRVWELCPDAEQTRLLNQEMALL